MIVAVSLAVAFALGLDWRRLSLLAGAVFFPWVAAVLIAWFAWKSRPDEDNRPSLFCEGVAAELRAGSTLRHALATAATSVGSESKTLTLVHDSPITEVAAQVAEEFPSIGEEVRLTVLSASRSGSQAADLFDEIGSLAIAQSEIRREVRMATAPGRATALVLVGAPLAFLATRAGAGGLSELVESQQQRAVVLIGLGLFLLGAAGAVLVVWKSQR